MDLLKDRRDNQPLSKYCEAFTDVWQPIFYVSKHTKRILFLGSEGKTNKSLLMSVCPPILSISRAQFQAHYDFLSSVCT